MQVNNAGYNYCYSNQKIQRNNKQNITFGTYTSTIEGSLGHVGMDSALAKLKTLYEADKVVHLTTNRLGNTVLVSVTGGIDNGVVGLGRDSGERLFSVDFTDRQANTHIRILQEDIAAFTERVRRERSLPANNG